MTRPVIALPERPRRSLLFVAVTGEEKGLQGSSYFAAQPTVPIDSIVARERSPWTSRSRSRPRS